MIHDIQRDAEKRMKKTLKQLSQELAKIRTGRARPSLLDSIQVCYFDALTPLRECASVVVEDAKTLSVTPFDKGMVAAVDKAIRNSGLGLNPIVAGYVIRVPLPPLTQERRIALAKQMKSEVEKSRVSMRNIRRDVIQSIKKLLKNALISEDEERRAQVAIQKLTDKNIKYTEALAFEKELDLMKD